MDYKKIKEMVDDVAYAQEQATLLADSIDVFSEIKKKYPTQTVNIRLEFPDINRFDICIDEIPISRIRPQLEALVRSVVDYYNGVVTETSNRIRGEI